MFPCRPGLKRPATTHGLHDATTDPDQVTAWWTTWPDANVALPTGRLFDVIDTDGPEGTRHFGVADVRDEPGLELLAWATTPHGFHYYVRPTGAGNRTRMRPGVDYRGTGGYVVAAPSRTDAGTYRWVDGHHLDPDHLEPA